MVIRKEWWRTWLAVAEQIANDRSCDEKFKVASLIVSEDNTQVLSLGYNGNYKGGPNERESLETGKSGYIHSEVNALIKCDFSFPKKKVMYVTHSPCISCSKLIINADISKVICKNIYKPDTEGLRLLVEVLGDKNVSVYNEALDRLDSASLYL